MKRLFQMAAVVLSLSAFIGCADEKADLEKARYLLGSGAKSDATEAIGILTPLLTSTTGAQRVEAYRLYAGAQLQSVGFSGQEILPSVQYPEKSGGTIQTAKMLKDALAALTDNTVAATAIAAAIAAYTTIQADTANFSAASAREQNGIKFQHGLATFLDAIRIVIVQTGYRDAASAAALSSVCTTNINDTDASNVDSQLGVTDTKFGEAGLDAQNQLRKAASDLRSGIGGLTAALLCTYLSGQF